MISLFLNREITYQEESLGTQLLFFYGPLLKDAFERGKTLILDEIDKSMHPSLVKFIMNLFRGPWEDMEQSHASKIRRCCKHILGLSF